MSRRALPSKRPKLDEEVVAVESLGNPTVAPKNGRGRPVRRALLIPNLEVRIFIRGSRRVSSCLESDYCLPDSLVDWAEKQRERNAGRVSGTRSLEKAMSEFKAIKFNDYLGVSVVVDKDQSMEDACSCDKQCDYKCINRSLQIECTLETCRICRRGQDCGNQRITKGEMKKMETRLVLEKGVGLFLLEPVSAGQYMQEYVGEVILEKECLRRLAQDYAEEKHKYLMNMSGGLIIDATRKGNVARFINHSCEPNCRVQEWKVQGEQRMGIFSLKPIEAGEELSFNYNFQRFGEGTQACCCGAPSCIRLLGGDHKDGRENGGSAVPQSNLVSLFPKGFFTQRDSVRKVSSSFVTW
ncbi:hypothetical protein BASA81_002969 [Batrachochytrium salamandrivorans]|nr:hypothetical protein BASA81_002969 [Batrachochytrium salamandrivorans]